MTGYIAFIRGINVGGKNIIKKEKLAEIFVSAGLNNVKTFIQSGNVFFTTGGDTGQIKNDIEEALYKHLGNRVPVMIMAQSYIAEVVNEYPFKDIPADPDLKTYYVILEGDPAKDIPVPFESEKDGILFFHRKGLIFCATSKPVNGKYFYPNAVLEKLSGTPATTRNIKTMKALAEIS
ncbi:MAG: DUF1697 domain-containing protein [Ignavibacteriaceae bacterium]|nr:DUF1697 domain-containing protein [Ignavibacteriaceae bacterium]